MPDIRAPEAGRCHVMHSDDEGLTWSKPETLVDTDWTDLHSTILELDRRDTFVYLLFHGSSPRRVPACARFAADL